MAAPAPERSVVAARSALNEDVTTALALALIAVAEELAELRREVRHGRVSGERQARRG